MAGIQLIEELTGKVWNFSVALPVPTGPDGLAVLPSNEFGFIGHPWAPGFYVLTNESGANVQIVLFGQTFVVPNNTKWRFMAHQDLESAKLLWAGTGAVGKQFPYGSAAVPSTGL